MDTLKVEKSVSLVKYNQSKFKSKPLVKWSGSKTQIVDKILVNFPSEIDNYHELFLGGGSVLLGLLKKIKQNLHINISPLPGPNRMPPNLKYYTRICLTYDEENFLIAIKI